MCGAVNLDPKYRSELANKNFLFDDTGDNVSHLNPYIGDLTGLYWIWKNTSNEFVGTNQWRRFYDDTTVQNTVFDEKALYVSSPYTFTDQNIYEQFVWAHGELGLSIVKEAGRMRKIDLDPVYIDKLKTIHFISPANMFFAYRPLFDKLCTVLFEIIFELYEGTKYALPFMQESRDKRMLAFLAERILNIIYIEKNYYLGTEYNIVSMPWRHHD
jgi:hypothetical protein